MTKMNREYVMGLKRQSEVETDRGVYLPSPEEIARKAAEIREGWSPREHLTHLNSNYQSPDVEIPQCDGGSARRGVEFLET